MSYSGIGLWSFFFFFQAEDGIRDLTVTGVQTCALPICRVALAQPHDHPVPVARAVQHDASHSRGVAAVGARGNLEPYRVPGRPNDDGADPAGGGGCAPACGAGRAERGESEGAGVGEALPEGWG